MEQQKSWQPMLFLGHYDINQVEMLTTLDKKMVLLIEHNYVNQTGIFSENIINVLMPI